MASRGGWGNKDGWEQDNWEAVRQQEQKKQEVLIKASQNSEKIRQMVRETERTRAMGAETLTVLDNQTGKKLSLLQKQLF